MVVVKQLTVFTYMSVGALSGEWGEGARVAAECVDAAGMHLTARYLINYLV